MGVDGHEVLGTEETQDGRLWVPEWSHEEVQSSQRDHQAVLPCGEYSAAAAEIRGVAWSFT